MEAKFKIGDRVRCVSGWEERGLVEGQELTVFGVDGDWVKVEWDGIWFYATRFKLAEPAPLKIEPGKYYRTRNKRKAYVGYRHPDWVQTSYPFVGHVEEINETTLPKTWTDNGETYFSEKSDSDLVAEWVEPVVREVLVSLLPKQGLGFGEYKDAIGNAMVTVREGEWAKKPTS